MHKLFDKTLTLRLKQVFQNHQEEYRPDDWEKLRAKLTKENKAVIIWFPLWAKAATVALLIGLSVFLVNVNQKEKTNELVSKSIIENRPNRKTDTLHNQILISQNTEDKEQKFIFQNKNTLIDKFENTNGLINESKKSDTKIEQVNNENETVFANSDTIVNIDSSEFRIANLNKEFEKQKEETKVNDNSISDSNKINLYIDKTEFEIVDKTNNSKHFDFGVELASVSNYAVDGAGNSLNVGGGISTSWNISKNFSISTGMIIARQSMDYNQGESNEMLSSTRAAKDFNAPANTIAMLDMNTAESKLEFVGIDIPLNVQFKLNKMILTTGFSSLLYVQEKFSYSYKSMVTNSLYNSSTAKYETQNTVNQVNEQEKSELFNRFDFARLLNVAIGYKIPLAKGDLVLEPYLKLPIGYISSQEIKMGSGGFAVRYNF